MEFKITAKWYDPQTGNTNVTLMSNKPFYHLSAEVVGNRTNETDEQLIPDALESVFKILFVDRAMPEAIKKVDNVSDKVVEVEELTKALEAAIGSANSLINHLKNKIDVVEQKQNKINEAFVLSENLSDEQKAILLQQFKPWTIGEKYEADEIINFEGNLYRVIKGIEAQGHYLPDSTPSEYTPVKNTTTVIDGETVEVINDWVQPTGAHDAYEKGDKVRFNGKVYESTLDQPNTWSPTDYPQGWKEVL